MTDNDALRTLLQRALRPLEDRPPSRDLWPEVIDRRPPPHHWTWLDFGAAAAIAVLLVLFPGCFWLLLYHL